MTPLPPPLGRGEIRFWRLDAAHHAASWASAEGSFRVGGRWNSPGVRMIYAALDPATATLEVAVHKGFRVLDTQPHILTSGLIADPASVHVVHPGDIPNPHWLSPCTPNTNQQTFGDALMAQHPIVLIPSAVSRHSWNVLLNTETAPALWADIAQDRFALDPRLQG